MGRAKQWDIEQWERGWYSIEGKYVCAGCLDDDALQTVVLDNAKEFECDYCGRSADDTDDPDQPIAAPFDSVMEVIARGIYKVWNSADDEGVPYESREGGYQFHTTDTYDLVHNNVPTENTEFLNDVVRSLLNQEWCPRDFARLSLHDELLFDWEHFCELVKHKNRYMFNLEADLPDEEDEFRSASPARILNELGRIVRAKGLLKRIEPGTIFTRARIHDARRRYTSPQALGPPPANKSRFANRMSSAGIPMFYGAFDPYTAVAEILTRRLRKEEVISVAQFSAKKQFTVVDLSSLAPIPSLFSDVSRNDRDTMSFLHSFVRDLSRPIRKDGREHIEYVPTQIVTEYFRYGFQPQAHEQVCGLLYPSARSKRGISCVLFFSAEQCGAKAKPTLALPKHWLELNRKNIRRLRGRPSRPGRRTGQLTLFSKHSN